MNNNSTALSKKVRERAGLDKLPLTHLLYIQADAFDKVDEEYNVAKYLGIWAKTRRIWCEYTGEPLI